MPSARIIIADSKPNSRKMLRESLNRAGYNIQAEARNVPDLLRKARTILPDLVILDSNLEGGSTLEVTSILMNDNLGTVLVLKGEGDNRYLGDIIQIPKPYTEDVLLSVIEVCILYQNKLQAVQQEVDRLKESLSNRKIIEKAKGVLMTNLGIPENEAYRLMQKESMDRGISLKDLARAIIAADENQNNHK